MIIEWLKVKVSPELRERYIQKDAELWTAALSSYPGFLSKEVLWIHPENLSEVVLVTSFLQPKHMPHCPHCHQSVSAQAIACPHCKTLLKAHGHPGIPLHRAVGEVSLCQTCLYHADDTCNFPQRPDARECTLYRNQSEALKPTHMPTSIGRNWFRRNNAWLFLLGLVAIALLLAL